MNSTVIVGIIRHILTTLGGILVAKGQLDSANLETIAGGLSALVGVVWSVYDKRTKPLVVTNSETETK